MYDLFVIFITEIYNYEDNKCKLYRLALKIVSENFGPVISDIYTWSSCKGIRMYILIK